MNRLFLDLDGVLVNFQKGIFDAFGLIYKEPKVYEFWQTPDFPYSFVEVNEKCNRGFWANLEWMPDGREILDLAESFFMPENIYLLTTPMPNPESWAGKFEWVSKNLPEYKNHLIITLNCKSVFAQSNHLLIDDKTQNVEQFTASSGQGILVPRPWNTLDSVDVCNHIENKLISWFERTKNGSKNC